MTKRFKVKETILPITREYYNNGQLCREFSTVNGRREGRYRRWYRNGELKYECNYQNGNRQGVCKQWNWRGERRSTQYYENDKRISKTNI